MNVVAAGAILPGVAGMACMWRPAVDPQRASDIERENAADSLRRHYAAGRLGLEELEERVHLALRARTRQDIRRLFRDLPSDRWGRALRRFEAFQRRLLAVHAAGYVGVNGSLVGIWSLTGGEEFWPAWSLVPGTALLGWHAGGVYLLWRAVRWRPRRAYRPAGRAPMTF